MNSGTSGGAVVISIASLAVTPFLLDSRCLRTSAFNGKSRSPNGERGEEEETGVGECSNLHWAVLSYSARCVKRNRVENLASNRWAVFALGFGA